MTITWKALVSDLDGLITGELEVSTFTFRKVLSNIGGWSATVKTQHWASNPTFIKPGKSMIWFIDEDEENIFGGFLWLIQPPASRDDSDIKLNRF